MNQIIAYSEACRAVAAAKDFDEVQELSSRAEAMRAYAVQANNRQLEIDAAEIRIRAQRRLGEMLLSLKADIGLNGGGRPGGIFVGRRSADDPRPRLADIGVDQKLSMRAQILARQSAVEFEQAVDRWRSDLAFSHKRAKVTLPRPDDVGRQKTAFDFPLIDGARIGGLRLGQIRARVSALLDEAAVLQNILKQVGGAADQLARVADVVSTEFLDGQVHALQEARSRRRVPQ